MESMRQELAELQVAVDTFWLLFTGSLVFFMQCGFGMLEAGAVKSRSSQNIMLKNLFDAALGGMLWCLIGYGITNEGGSPFIGITPYGNRTGSHFALSDLMAADEDLSRPPTEGTAWADVFFQFTFAAASSTIVSGAVAERAKLPAYLVFTSLITGLVYPVVAHWVWSPAGWLAVSNSDAVAGGLVDFAGSGVVHMTGGIAALAGATIIGPRTGRFDASSGAVVPMPGHSAVLQVLGTFILWLGWYGFNTGSTMSLDADNARIAGRVVLTTTLSACAGGISGVALERMRGITRLWDVVAMCNGILAGLVSITAGCATVTPWAAAIIGAVGGAVCRFASKALLRCRVDDPLDAFAVHGACGCWGLLAAALFTTPHYAVAIAGADASGGLFYGGGAPLAAAALFLIASVGWVGTLTCCLFAGLNYLGLLRVPPEEEAPTGAGAVGAAASGKGADTAENMDGSTHAGEMYQGMAAVPHLFSSGTSKVKASEA